MMRERKSFSAAAPFNLIIRARVPALRRTSPPSRPPDPDLVHHARGGPEHQRSGGALQRAGRPQALVDARSAPVALCNLPGSGIELRHAEWTGHGARLAADAQRQVARRRSRPPASAWPRWDKPARRPAGRNGSSSWAERTWRGHRPRPAARSGSHGRFVGRPGGHAPSCRPPRSRSSRCTGRRPPARGVFARESSWIRFVQQGPCLVGGLILLRSSAGPATPWKAPMLRLATTRLSFARAGKAPRGVSTSTSSPFSMPSRAAVSGWIWTASSLVRFRVHDQKRLASPERQLLLAATRARGSPIRPASPAPDASDAGAGWAAMVPARTRRGARPRPRARSTASRLRRAHPVQAHAHRAGLRARSHRRRRVIGRPSSLAHGNCCSQPNRRASSIQKSRPGRHPAGGSTMCGPTRPIGRRRRRALPAPPRALPGSSSMRVPGRVRERAEMRDELRLIESRRTATPTPRARFRSR